MFIDGRTKSYLLVIGEKANIVNVLNKIILYMYTSLHQCFSTVCNKLYGQPFGLSLLKQWRLTVASISFIFYAMQAVFIFRGWPFICLIIVIISTSKNPQLNIGFYQGSSKKSVLRHRHPTRSRDLFYGTCLFLFLDATKASFTWKCALLHPVWSWDQTPFCKRWNRRVAARLATSLPMGSLVSKRCSARELVSTHRSLLLTMTIM